MDFLSRSPQETQRLGEELGRRLQAGDVVGLCGELGSGKTTFTKGLARGLGMQAAREVRSPTFVLMQVLAGRVPIYHLDLYRLDDPAQIEQLAVREFLGGDGVAVIEWAQKYPALLPANHLQVEFEHQTRRSRRIRLRGRGGRAQALLQQVRGIR